MMIVLQWTACVMLLLGLHQIGRKELSGFYVALVAEVLWVLWGCLVGAWGLVAMSLAICVMYVLAIRSWRRS